MIENCIDSMQDLFNEISTVNYFFFRKKLTGNS